MNTVREVLDNLEKILKRYLCPGRKSQPGTATGSTSYALRRAGFRSKDSVVLRVFDRPLLSIDPQ